MRMHWCSEQVHTGSVSQGKIRVLKTVQIMGWCADMLEEDDDELCFEKYSS